MSGIRARAYLLTRRSYPFTIRIFSGKTGEELWSRVVQLPEGPLSLAAVRIPGWGGTEHVPVRIRIEYADGTVYEE